MANLVKKKIKGKEYWYAIKQVYIGSVEKTTKKQLQKAKRL